MNFPVDNLQYTALRFKAESLTLLFTLFPFMVLNRNVPRTSCKNTNAEWDKNPTPSCIFLGLESNGKLIQAVKIGQVYKCIILFEQTPYREKRKWLGKTEFHSDPE